jgi:hypothetical protein
MKSGKTATALPKEQDPRITNLIQATMQQMLLDKELFDLEHPEHSRTMCASDLLLLARRKVMRELSDPSRDHKP